MVFHISHFSSSDEAPRGLAVWPGLPQGWSHPSWSDGPLLPGTPPRHQVRLVLSHWSRNVEARLSLVESLPTDACASNLIP